MPDKKQRTRSRRAPRGGWRTARGSDRHELYELSVQEPAAEIAFIERRFRERTGGTPRLLREDFCGTGWASCEWVRRRTGNEAWGVDLCARTQAWGKARHWSALPAGQRARVHWVHGDVRDPAERPVDVIAALNFSYFVFKTRAQLVGYFRAAFSNLRPGGMIALDAYGGSDSFLVQTEERDLDGFTYLWHTERYNPINGDVLNRIHFRFPDGTEMRNAFTYDWRLWTLPEIQEALLEAGFVRPAVYWEGTPKDGEGDGVFRRKAVGEACEGWIAYVVAERPAARPRASGKAGRAKGRP
jgi:SAM-dependent methyltransferase